MTKGALWNEGTYHIHGQLQASIGRVAGRAANGVVDLKDRSCDVDASPQFVNGSRAESSIQQQTAVDRSDSNRTHDER